MLEHLPQEIRDGLEIARQRRARRQAKLWVQIGDAAFPVLRLWSGGFSVDAAKVPVLRGLVDLHEGGRHITRALIVASRIEGNELICEFKWQAPVSDGPALDYWLDPTLPVGLLPRH